MTTDTPGYAGDVTPQAAWDMLKAEPARTKLVDVRTLPEWKFVGVPDLAAAGGRPVLASWQVYPDNELNPGFAGELLAAGVQPGDSVLFLCRSGARSRAAAIAMTQAGFAACYNIVDGFEGAVDAQGHRGQGGWKAAGLPWRQS